MIDVIDVSKSYGKKEVLKGLNLSIKTGSFTAILGPNDAGKSTLFKILLGVSPADSGQVVAPEEAKIGVVFQQSCLDDYLTVRENLLVRVNGDRKPAKKRVTALLSDLDLTPLAKQLYGTLSGGQKRRVDIARALLSEPDVLFLDEPTTGLDTQTRQAIWRWLQDLQANKGLTLVLTTHYLHEADAADQIYILDQGQVLASGSPQELKDNYAQAQLFLFAKDDRVASLVANSGLSADKIGSTVFVRSNHLGHIIALLQQVQPYLRDFSYQSGSLDDVFMTLTGRDIRDDQ